MKIIILEDLLPETAFLKRQLESWSELNKIEIEIDTYTSGEVFFNKNPMITNSICTVFFLDIQMGEMNGMDVARRLRMEGYTGPIIFLTAFREYVFEGYDVHAMNYLLKPVQREPLFRCLDEIATSLSGNVYLYRNKNDIIRIPYKDIFTITASLHYVDILTVSGVYSQYANLNQVIEHLPKEFIRIHRSCIVNMAHIHKIAGSTITLSNRMTAVIGRTYLKAVTQEFIRYSTRLD